MSEGVAQETKINNYLKLSGAVSVVIVSGGFVCRLFFHCSTVLCCSSSSLLGCHIIAEIRSMLQAYTEWTGMQ